MRDSDQSDDTADDVTAKPPSRQPLQLRVPKSPASNKAVMGQRVTAVFGMMVDGLQRNQIIREVAKQQGKEERKRAEALKENATGAGLGRAGPSCSP